MMRESGPDSVPNVAMSKLALAHTIGFLKIYNACLNEGHFHERLKVARLALLLKELDKPISSPSSFRPICPLDAAGKVLEYLLLKSINKYFETNGRLSERPFGFRRGRIALDGLRLVMGKADAFGAG